MYSWVPSENMQFSLDAHNKQHIVSHLCHRELFGSLGHLNMAMMSYRYRYPHGKDKTVLWPSDLWHGKPYTWKDGFILKQGIIDFSHESKIYSVFCEFRMW